MKNIFTKKLFLIPLILSGFLCVKAQSDTSFSVINYTIINSANNHLKQKLWPHILIKFNDSIVWDNYISFSEKLSNKVFPQADAVISSQIEGYDSTYVSDTFNIASGMAYYLKIRFDDVEEKGILKVKKQSPLTDELYNKLSKKKNKTISPPDTNISYIIFKMTDLSSCNEEDELLCPKMKITLNDSIVWNKYVNNSARLNYEVLPQKNAIISARIEGYDTTFVSCNFDIEPGIAYYLRIWFDDIDESGSIEPLRQARLTNKLYARLNNPNPKNPLPVILVGYLIIIIFSLWFIFQKAGHPGWAGVIPIYNLFIYLKIIEKPWWWIFLLCIPYLNIIWVIWSFNLLAKSFDKNTGFTLGLVFLGPIFFPILAFDRSMYYGKDIPERKFESLKDNYIQAHGIEPDLICSRCGKAILSRGKFLKALEMNGLALNPQTNSIVVSGAFNGYSKVDSLQILAQKLEDLSALKCNNCGNVYCLTCLFNDAPYHPTSGGEACFSCGGSVSHAQ